MSFPRAKIQRFNDIKDCTPSPADYDIKLKNKNKGAAISQSDRFTELRSPSTSDNGSTHSTPCFRPPLYPKLKKKAPIDLKEKPKPKDLLQNDLELLNEKIVECKNKDAYIKDLVEQIDNMKDKLAGLEIEKTTFESERRLLEEQMVNFKAEHEQNVNDLKNLHRNHLSNIISQIVHIREELMQLYQEYIELKEVLSLDLKKLEKEQSLYSEEITNMLKMKSFDIIKKEKEMQLLKDSWNEIQNKHRKDLENLEALHTEELEFLKTAILQGLFNHEEQIDELVSGKNTVIKELLNCIKKEYGKLESDFSHKLEEEREKVTAVQESELILKQKLEEAENTFRMKLEEQEKQHDQILKECQAISEYNIIQCELEKNDVNKKLLKAEAENDHLNKQLEDTCNRYSSLKDSYNKLQTELEKMIKQLDNMQDKMKTGIESKEIQITHLLSEKHTYEISINKCQETIQVLTKRLMDSDKDVEQLKDELNKCESKLLLYEDKCMHLNTELQELKNILDELEMQNESSLKLAEKDVAKVKEDLLGKLEKYRLESQKQISSLEEQLLKKEDECNTLKEQLQEHQKITTDCQTLVSKVDNHLESVESENKNLRTENQKLETIVEGFLARISSYEKVQNKCCELEKVLLDLSEENNHLQKNLKITNYEVGTLKQQLQKSQEENHVTSQNCEFYKNQLEEYKNEIDEAAEIRRKYIEQSMKYEELLEKFENLRKENEQHKKLIEEQESLIGPFREQLEKYELERKALLMEKDYMENEAREMGLKYAEILGHQNHKQKIKHVLNIKSKNDELTKQNLELDTKVRRQVQTIEKLKKENADLKKSLKKLKPGTNDKENFASPNVSLNSSKVESPGPLRERN